MAAGKLRNILGSMEFGRRNLTADAPCHEIIDSFLSRGYTEIDTGFMYTDGEAEKILGRFPDPNKVSLATKACTYHPKRMTHDGVIDQLATSLERFQVPSIDLFYLHWPDHETPIEETLSAVQELYTKGKFKEFGLCNFKSWEVAEVYYICKQNGWILPTVYQGMYNAVTRMVEGELFPCLRRFNMRFHAYNVLAGGVLTDNYKFNTSAEEQRVGRFWHGGNSFWEKQYRDRYWRESLFTGIDGIKESLASVYGSGKVSIANAAMRWMVHHSQLDPKYGDGIITGGSSLKHVNDNLDAFNDGPLDPSVVKAFDQAWQWDKANCATYYR
ncbi:aflatoxin B1 aldehyde reductase member 2-like [Dysidea avara]|uniref:aflatoxin B1 aldehyde reductase member 2-like n=1 Tax=Dysidea avara TaxID=196820 RepID=UPI0033225D71